MLVYRFGGRKTSNMLSLCKGRNVRLRQSFSVALLFSLLFSMYAQAGFSNVPVTLALTTAGEKNEFLGEVVRATLRRHFASEGNNYLSGKKSMSLADFAKQFKVAPRYHKHAGLFVTLSKGSETRACWGSLAGRYADLVQATVYTSEEALTDEYRYRKIRASELDLLTPQVTVVTGVEPLRNLSEQNPRLCGMLVRSGGKSGVILPGETTDPFYQLVQCKLKAGIKQNEPCQIYRIRADVYR